MWCIVFAFLLLPGLSAASNDYEQQHAVEIRSCEAINPLYRSGRESGRAQTEASKAWPKEKIGQQMLTGLYYVYCSPVPNSHQVH